MPTPKKAAPAKKAAPKAARSSAKKSAAAGKAPAGASSEPMIDTGIAAQAAARMLLARSAGKAVPAAKPAEESAGFKHLKEEAGKPHQQVMDALLNKTAPASAKRNNLPMPGGRNQTGHNQTFGADVNRANLPRRTGG